MSDQSEPHDRLDQLLDPNRVEELIPDCYADFRPLVVDALRFFLSRLSRRRWEEIAAAQATWPAGAAGRIVQLMHASPTLHKLGQVLARHRALDRELRKQLQQLESFEPKTPRSVIQTILDQELREAVDRYAIAFEPRPIAEASVAVVTGCTWSSSANEPRRRAALKVLKPGVEERLAQELAILGELADYLDERRSAYHLPNFEYRDTFETVRDILESETHFEIEQRNLDWAARRHAHRDDVTIPAVLPFCTPRVTAMDHIDGVKVTHDGDRSTARRKAIARTIIDALLGDVIFSPEAETIFHADPHAGNLLAAPGGRLAILDWSLTGRLTKAQREQIVQIILAAMRLDAAGVCRAIESLSDSKIDETSARGAADRSIRSVARGKLPGPSWLTHLLDALAAVGVRFPADLLLLRKAILIVEGVIIDIDGAPPLDAALIARAMMEFGAEWPARVFADPSSRRFASQISNADFARAAASLPAAAMRFWLRAWSAWTEAQ